VSAAISIDVGISPPDLAVVAQTVDQVVAISSGQADQRDLEVQVSIRQVNAFLTLQVGLERDRTILVARIVSLSKGAAQ
jgi:hypothetical protein